MAPFLKRILTVAADRLTNRNVLYYPGCITKFALREHRKKYEDILRRLGIDFITLKDKELCCGSPVLHAGYVNDFEKIKAKNLEVFAKYGISKIITNCPGCYHMFAKEYGIRTEHITQTIAKRLSKIRPGKNKGRISYHDPCHLGRQSGVYDEPREVIKSMGFDLCEMQGCRETAVCCGGGGGLSSNFPEVADKAAKNRLAMSSTQRIITTCPMCYLHMKKNSTDHEVLELSEVLDL